MNKCYFPLNIYLLKESFLNKGIIKKKMRMRKIK